MTRLSTAAAKVLGLCTIVMLGALATGCTITFPEHGRPFTVSPAANPNAPEAPVSPSGPGLVRDER